MDKIILTNVVFLSRSAINLILLREFGTGNKISYDLAILNNKPDVKSVVLNDGDVRQITINGKDYPGASTIGIFTNEGLLEIHHICRSFEISTAEYLPLDGIWQFSVITKIEPVPNDHHGNEDDEG